MKRIRLSDPARGDLDEIWLAMEIDNVTGSNAIGLGRATVVPWLFVLLADLDDGELQDIPKVG